MKKYLFILILFNFAFSQFDVSGNDFLEEYPHNWKSDKDWNDLTPQQQIDEQFFRGLLIGWLQANEMTAITIGDFEIYNFSARLDGVDINQIIRIIKKWCDDNPTQTHTIEKNKAKTNANANAKLN